MTTVYQTNIRGLALMEDQSRMIVLRRELPRSNNVRYGLASIAQEPLEGSPYRDLFLLGIKTFQDLVPLNRQGTLREMTADGPDKSCQLSSARHDRDLRRLSAVHQAPIFAM